MSYTRWSSEIENGIPLTEYFTILREKGREGLKAERAKRGTITSDWYIYWHCSDGDERDDQLLAISHANDTGSPIMTYPEVRYAYDHDTWPHATMTQKSHMRSCVKEWLDEVEDEFKVEPHAAI